MRSSFVQMNCMKIRLLLLVAIASIVTVSQAQQIKTGDRFPDYIIRNLVNAPSKEVDINLSKGKYIVLNFWGTWCAPCIPEMDSLKSWQEAYGGSIQFIGITNDNHDRINKYLQKKPTKVWIAMDTAYYLYRQFGFSSVGQAAIIDKNHQVVAVVKTDSLSRDQLNKLLAGKPIPSNALLDENAAGKSEEEDLFALDTLQRTAVSLRSYIKGQYTMSKSYPNGPFKSRRRTYYNVCPLILYKEAYGIISDKQVVFDMPEKDACNFAAKDSLISFDILVEPGDEANLGLRMRNALNLLLPVKARAGRKSMTVYCLSAKSLNSFTGTPDNNPDPIFSFSGRGFNGKAVTLQAFCNYLTNELGLPVIDETGLKGTFDINTENVIRTEADVLTAVEKLGLVIEKKEREVDIITIYKQ